jgi:hypothetical protein
VEALSHASLAMHSVVIDRLAQHGDHLDGLVTDLRQGLDRQWEILEGLPAVIAGLQEQQVRFGAAIDRLERQSRRPDPGARVDGLVTGLVRGWDRFRELRGRRLT